MLYVVYVFIYIYIYDVKLYVNFFVFSVMWLLLKDVLSKL